jgi:hypothetical protein
MTAVRPIHLAGATALESLRERAVAALDAWAREWLTGLGPEGLSGLTDLVVATDARPLQAIGYEVLRVGSGAMWFRRSRSDHKQLGCAVVGFDAMTDIPNPDSWIEAVIDQACDDRDRRLCSALMGAPVAGAVLSMGALPDELFAFGSGAVYLSCELLGLHAIADGTVWRGTPPVERSRQNRRPKVTPLDTAVRSATARVEVVLGSVEVELPKVLDLRCGDVLRLPQRLERAITVLCEGRPLARAALGEHQGRKSVQLLSDSL